MSAPTQQFFDRAEVVAIAQSRGLKHITESSVDQAAYRTGRLRRSKISGRVYYRIEDIEAWFAGMEPPTRPRRDLDELAEILGQNAVALPVEKLNLSVRSYNCLVRKGVRTVGDLTACTDADLMALRMFGQICLDEVKAKLQQLGLSLATETGHH